jgi:predicted nucleic acid-binding Zn ribbon protein
MRNAAPNPPRRRRAAAGSGEGAGGEPPAWDRERSPPRQCVICGKKFPARNFAKTCSPDCSEKLRNHGRREHYAENRETILAQQKKARDAHSPITMRKCAISDCPNTFSSRYNRKTCSPEHLREYRWSQGHKYYLANREKWEQRERLRQAKWSPKPRQCVVCGEDFIAANRKNSRAKACPKHRHDRKLQMERARYHAKYGPRSSENRSISA